MLNSILTIKRNRKTILRMLNSILTIIITREHTISGEIVRVCLWLPQLPIVSLCLLISTTQCFYIAFRQQRTFV